MKFLNHNKVLCLSPHPDDVEYGMLGVISKYGDTQFDILVLSEGGDFDSTVKQKRHNESKKALDGIANSTCFFSDIKFIKDMAEDEWINLIENKYNIKGYDCIFHPPSEDSHFDHRFINQLSPALVRGYSCSRISYKTASVLDTWIPNLFVSLNNKVWKDKSKRLLNFNSQLDKSYFNTSSIESFHSNYECSKRGMNLVESFRI